MKTNNNDLYDLILALSPSEKRYFHRFAQRHIIGEGNIYLKLFKILSAQDIYDEASARTALQQEKARFAVSKKQLYNLVLESLQQYHRDKESKEIVKRWVQSAHILIDKSLIKQAEKLWKKAWKKAQSEQLLAVMPEILLLERTLIEKKISDKKSEHLLVEWRHKWKAMQAMLNQMGNAAYFSLSIAQQHYQKVRLGNKAADKLALKMLESEAFKEASNSTIASVQLDCQRALSTYHFMQGDALEAYASNVKLLALFDKHSFLSDQYPSRYLMALNNFLIDNFQLHNWETLEDGLKKLKKLPDTPSFKKLRGIKKRIYEQSTLLEVNMLSMQKEFARLSILSDKIIKSLPQYGGQLSYPNQQSLFYLLALGNCFAGKADKALDHINQMLESYQKNTLEELHHYARLLQLLIHYELDNYELLPYLIASVKRILPKQTLQSTHLLIARLNQLLGAANRKERQSIYHAWAEEINQKELSKHESRFYEYLDLQYWLKKRTASKGSNL